MGEVTQVLNEIDRGDGAATERLLPLVYEELRKLAAAKLALEKPGQTLQATALVHEAYLRLVGAQSVRPWKSRGHFFAAAAEAMRRILVEQARKKARQKRGGNRRRIDIDAVDIGVNTSPDQLLRIDEALEALKEHDPSAAEVVKLRYFAGLTIGQAAECLGISVRTAYRHWNYARVWLHGELMDSGT